ncbi:MAG: hypothetical protein Q7S32_04935 [bacterium]|nr:hypothetical protein [bacterium]
MKSKDITNKIVEHIRQNGGRTEFKMTELANKWGCAKKSISRTLLKFLSKSIIVVVDGTFFRGISLNSGVFTFAMAEAFREGDTWRKAYYTKPMGRPKGGKNRPKADKTPPVEAPLVVSGVELNTEEEIASRATILRELVAVYEKLQKEQQANIPLREEIAKLEEELRVLRAENALLLGSIDEANRARQRHKENAEKAEAALRAKALELRKSTAGAGITLVANERGEIARIDRAA